MASYASIEYVYFFSLHDLSKQRADSVNGKKIYAEPVSNTGEMKGVLWLYLDFFSHTFYSTIQICRLLLFS